jgi:hypothetical protein
MRSDENLMTVDLVVAVSQMLFCSGGESFRKTGMSAAACAPGFQLAPVLEKVSVHPRKFAPEVTLLAFADGAEINVLAEMALKSARRWRRVRAWAMKVLEGAARRRGRLSRWQVRHSHSCKARGDLTLRGEELRKDHDSAFRTRQRRKHPEFLFENPRRSNALAPASGESRVRKGRHRLATGRRAAAHRLKKDASAQTGLSRR